jgi:hypothetical protein
MKFGKSFLLFHFTSVYSVFAIELPPFEQLNYSEKKLITEYKVDYSTAKPIIEAQLRQFRRHLVTRNFNELFGGQQMNSYAKKIFSCLQKKYPKIPTDARIKLFYDSNETPCNAERFRITAENDNQWWAYLNLFQKKGKLHWQIILVFEPGNNADIEAGRGFSNQAMAYLFAYEQGKLFLKNTDSGFAQVGPFYY